MRILVATYLVCCGVGAFAASIEDLVRHRNQFYREDVDDDGLMEYADVRQSILRVDKNRDGNLGHKEEDADAVGVSKKEYSAYDVNKDGVLNIADAELTFFYYMVDAGNDWDMREYLEFITAREESTGDEITIPAFIKAEGNFRVSDIDDNDIVSFEEYESEYRAADYNQDGILTDLEVNGFRPTRNIPISNFCTDPSIGCSFDNFKPLFKQADTDNNGQLSLTEYVITFGPLENKIVDDGNN